MVLEPSHEKKMLFNRQSSLKIYDSLFQNKDTESSKYNKNCSKVVHTIKPKVFHILKENEKKFLGKGPLSFYVKNKKKDEWKEVLEKIKNKTELGIVRPSSKMLESSDKCPIKQKSNNVFRPLHPETLKLKESDISLKDEKINQQFILKKVVKKNCLLSFEKFLSALEKVFTHNFTVHDYNCLESYQHKLLALIVRKSLTKLFQITEKRKRSTYKEDVKRIRKLLDTNSFLKFYDAFTKLGFIDINRKEEKLKFVFKNTINFFRKQYFKEYDLKAKSHNEILFLRRFFSEHMKTFNLNETAFSDPLNSYKIKNPEFGSLDRKYFKHIFILTGFKEKFLNHLDISFREDYKDSIKNKLQRILHPLKRMLKSKDKRSEEECYEEFMVYLGKQRTFRSPWFKNEVDNSIETFKTHIESVLTHS